MADYPSPTKINSLEDYMEWRQWNLAGVPNGDLDKATDLVSHVLSAPLTAASQIFPTLLPIYDDGRRELKPLNWCFLGARSEASLPVEYWGEMLVFWAHVAKRQSPLHITCDFLGPDILRRPPVQLSYLGHTLSLRWLYNGTFHEYLERARNPASASDDMVLVDENTWDAYILFNPGVGHPTLKKDWEPTLDLLLSSTSTIGMTGTTARIVFTAHSEQDASRDADCLINYLLPEAPLYRENPFASRIRYQDPFDEAHMVRPNQSAYTLVWQ
jgi:hypothetical protein